MREDWTGETSGSIDLRELSASLVRDADADARDERDEIARIVTSREALVPLELPPVRERTSSRTLLASAAGAATLAASLAVFAAVPSWRASAPRLATDTPAPPEAPARTAPDAPEPVVELTPPAPEPALDPAPAPAPPPPARERPRVARVPSAPARVAPDPSTPAPTASSDPSIDPALAAALDAALSGGSIARPTETLPATPSQHEVRTTLRSLERAVAQCREGEGGLVEVRLAIEGASGRVASVDVRGDAVRGAVARCVEDVIDDATFSRFERDRFAVSYPFRI